MNEAAILALINTYIFQNGNRLISGAAANTIFQAVYHNAQFNELQSGWVAANTPIVTGDSIAAALGKSQGQINYILTQLTAGAGNLNFNQIIWVDGNYGDDSTAVPYSLSLRYASVDAAINASSFGDVIVITDGQTSNTDMFVNNLTYLIMGSGSLTMRAGGNPNTGENYRFIGEGRLAIQGIISIAGAYNGEITIDMKTLEMDQGYIYSDSSGSAENLVRIKAASISIGNFISLNHGKTRYIVDVDTFTNEDSTSGKNAGFIFNTTALVGTERRQNIINIKKLNFDCDLLGLVYLNGGIATEDIFLNTVAGRLGNAGVPPSTLAGLVNCVGGASNIHVDGTYNINGLSYLVCAHSGKLRAKGLVYHSTSDAMFLPISLGGTTKTILEAEVNTDNILTNILNINDGTISVGACRTEIRGVLRNTVSTTFSIVKITGDNSAVHVLNGCTLVAYDMTKDVIKATIAINVNVYAAYVRGVVTNVTNTTAGVLLAHPNIS